MLWIILYGLIAFYSDLLVMELTEEESKKYTTILKRIKSTDTILDLSSIWYLMKEERIDIQLTSSIFSWILPYCYSAYPQITTINLSCIGDLFLMLSA